MAEYVFTLRNVRKAHGDKVVLDNVTLSFLHGAKIGVVGPNGTGKSTLLKIMAGLEREFQGEAWSAEGASVGFLSQEPQLDPEKTVEQNILEGLGETKALVDRFEAISARFAEELSEDEMNALLAEQAELQEKIDAAGAWDLGRTIEIAMDALNLPAGDSPVTTLSGGERRRVALCRLLLSQPDLLLLDEPTNHLDLEASLWLESWLARFPGAALLVSVPTGGDVTSVREAIIKAGATVRSVALVGSHATRYKVPR